ncbi:MAG TPA: MBL fold metallo-hydrolase [Polyangiaceae bacterium]|nr:MBL fold metallo-hydrolase [Polyangiaceae bacterium]
MTRLVCVQALALTACLAACKATPDDPLSKGVAALGGQDTLGAAKTFLVKGTVKQWEPGQSVVADGEPRLGNESTFTLLTDLAAGTSRTDWERKYLYPAPRNYTYSEIVTPTAGYVAGIDSTGRTKPSLDSNPPAHTMSGLRLAAFQREATRTSPVLLFSMSNARERVSPVADVTVGGTAYPALEYRQGEQALTVMFDRTSGLPARIRSLDYDDVWGDVNYDLVLSDWRAAGKLQVPGTRKYELNGRTVSEIQVSDVEANVPVPADRVTIPGALLGTAAKPAASKVPYQWVLRRQFIGTYLDSDDPSFDTRAATPGLRLSEVGAGIQQVLGGSHNSLLIEMKDHLIAFDAPVSDAQALWTLAAAKEKFPNKPVKYLVLMHHHMDHAGGLRAYAAQGATLVVAKGNADYFRKVLAAPFTRNPHLKARDLSATPIVDVADRHVLGDGTREVTLQVIENPHAVGMLYGYIADASLGWVTDLWSPGRDPLPEKLNPNQAAFVAGVKKAGLVPAKVVSAHGSSGEFAALAALEGK